MKNASTMRNIIITVLVAWLSFWWGQYVGELNVTSSWLASERSDLQTLSLLKRIVEAEPAIASVVAAQSDAKNTEIRTLEEAKEFSIVHFVLFPVLGPFRRLALAQL